MNIKRELENILGVDDTLHLNDIEIEPSSVKAIMINEVVPSDPMQDFYGQVDADYMKTTIPLFHKAGLDVSSIHDILKLGIYITNAVKTPKTDYAIKKESIEKKRPIS